MRMLAALMCLAASASIFADSTPSGLRDLYFGEALYYADQGDYFDALQRLDTEMAQYYAVDEPGLDTLHFHIKDAEFSVGDFELDYRMHNRAGRAITHVLEADVAPEVRNEAAFRLAQIQFEKGQLDDSLQSLGRIAGRVPDGLGDEIAFLRANVLLADGRPDEAADTLRRVQSAESLHGFAAYNLGIALLEEGDRQTALEQLDRAGRVDGDDPATRSIRDKANLVRGNLLLDDEDFHDAEASLDRVSLVGPFSNRALLAEGWAAASSESFDRAIVPWSILAARNDTDAAVQEARLALPYAYGQLGIHGRAALLYGDALDSFDTEVGKLDASIESVRKGDFLKALVREEIRQDRDWVIRLRELPESPETYYLMELMASDDFQTALQNYLDLEDIRSRLASWQRGFDAYEDMIELRRRYYEPLLPEIDDAFRELDANIRLRREQQKLLQQRLDDMLTSPRPEFLATTEERLAGERLDEIDRALERDSSGEADALRKRSRRLRGFLSFTLETEYHDRLTRFDGDLRGLGAAIETMTTQYASFVRTRQAAVHSYEGFQVPIRRLRTRVAAAASSVDMLMARQGHVLERVAIDELVARRDRLDNYRDQARFALADSYDRATKEQAAGPEQVENADGVQANLSSASR